MSRERHTGRNTIVIGRRLAAASDAPCRFRDTMIACAEARRPLRKRLKCRAWFALESSFEAVAVPHGWSDSTWEIRVQQAAKSKNDRRGLYTKIFPPLSVRTIWRNYGFYSGTDVTTSVFTVKS